MNRNCVIPALIALVSVGCRRDMQTQPKYMPLSLSQFYPDGRAARPTPVGAIAVDEIDDSSPEITGAANGSFLTTIPMPVSAVLLQRGQERFNIFCSPCHGRTGDGQGMVARQGLKQPADLNGDRVRNAPPGYLYQVIVNGYGAMDDYSYQIQSVRDRWAIVAYIRALELSRRTSLTDVPPEDRPALEGRR